MIVPNKFTSFDQSILANLSNLLKIEVKEIELSALFKQTEKKFTDIGEFLITLDVLYALGKVELNIEKGVITYVD